MSQKCDHFHVFVGVILRYPGENAVLSDKGRTELKKQKRFQCHAKLFEKPAVLAAPCVVANYLGNGDFFMINDNDWNLFGLRGASGGLFLNKLVKYIPQNEQLAHHLCLALPVPPSAPEGQHRT